MRTISELLTILRDNAGVYDNQIYDGLCWEVFELFSSNIISSDENNALCDYIDENMPKMINDDGLISDYGWPIGEWLPRLEWLNEHIELNKEKEQ